MSCWCQWLLCLGVSGKLWRGPWGPTGEAAGAEEWARASPSCTRYVQDTDINEIHWWCMTSSLLLNIREQSWQRAVISVQQSSQAAELGDEELLSQVQLLESTLSQGKTALSCSSTTVSVLITVTDVTLFLRLMVLLCYRIFQIVILIVFVMHNAYMYKSLLSLSMKLIVIQLSIFIIINDAISNTVTILLR